MKFRSKGIIGISIISIFTLSSLGIFINDGTFPVFIFILIVYIIVLFFRFTNYIKLDNEEVIQVKYNILFKKTTKNIPYKDIFKIEFGKNHTLSIVDIGENGHYIYGNVGENPETIKIGKIFHLKKFKKILNEKRYLMTQRIGNKDITKGERYYNIPNIFGGDTFMSYEGFIKLDNEKMVISKNHSGKYKIFNVKYQDIGQIAVVIVEDDNTCIYIKLKNQKLKEIFYGIKNGYAFMDAIKKRGINAYFVSHDEIISDIKDEDLY